MAEEKEIQDIKSTKKFVVPVCFMMHGTSKIRWDEAVEIKGANFFFKDGGWNPVSSCFLTEEHCRKYHEKPMDEGKIKKEIANALRKMADNLT